MVIRVLSMCWILNCCFDSSRGITGVGKSSVESSDGVYEISYGLVIRNSSTEACWNDRIQDDIEITVTVKVGEQIATSGIAAEATITLFNDGQPLAVNKAKRGLAVFVIRGDDFELDQYHYLEATAAIKGHQELTVLSDAFAFVRECGE